MLSNLELFASLYELFNASPLNSSFFYSVVASNNPKLIDAAITRTLNTKDFAISNVVAKDKKLIAHKAISTHLNLRNTDHNELGKIYFQLPDPADLGFITSKNSIVCSHYSIANPKYKISFVKGEFTLDDQERFFYNCEITFDILKTEYLLSPNFSSIYDFFAENLSKNIFNQEKPENNLFNNCIRLETKLNIDADNLLVRLKSPYSISQLYIDIYFQIFGSFGEKVSSFTSISDELTTIKSSHRRELLSIAAKYELLIAKLKSENK